jgi:aminocarboxymuconate-semialdehyde decarboxylase
MAGKVKRIDVHSHVLPRELIELIRKNPRDYQMRVEGTGDAEKFVRDDKHGTPIYAEFFDADAKVEGMDRKGIDISVISVTPVVFFYWLLADAGLAACRVMNDGIARMAAARPDRLRGMATLPLQNADAAIAELERVVKEHGFRSIELGCRVKGELLGGRKVSAGAEARRGTRRVHLRASVHCGRPAAGPRLLLSRQYRRNAFRYRVDGAHLMFSGALERIALNSR